MRYLILCFLLGCAVGVADPLSSEEKRRPEQQRPAPIEEDLTVADLKTDACVPDRFASNAIPENYRLDPSCPPEIYNPQRFIPPNDPGPHEK